MTKKNAAPSGPKQHGASIRSRPFANQPKFKEQPCSQCGSPRSVVNGQWLRERRKRAGYSLRAFAARVGVSAAHICDIEHNRRNCLPAMRDAYENIASFEQTEITHD